MPLSKAFQKLVEEGLLTALAPRPPPQLMPPQFRLDLHYAYYQGPRHDIDRCFALRYAIRDLIDQGLVNLGQPSVTTNPYPAHTTHSVLPPIGDDGYEIVMTHSGKIAQVAPLVTRPFGGTDSREEIRVETSATPEELIYMMTADRVTCIMFSVDDLPPEGSDHNRHLYIIVVCSSHRVPSVLLDNGSALNVCPLATTIALGFAPSDFGSSTETVLRIPASFNLLLGQPWIHHVRAIPSSFHQKVKFIHDGQVITVQDFVAMSFNQHSSTLVLDMMRDMSFLPGFGLGRHQHGSSEFVTTIDHDTPFGLGFVPTKADYRYMAFFLKERLRAQLLHMPFDYPIRHTG
ncbi:hypothetical protein AAG906_011237 [Vitis piasezkii]